MISKMCDFNEPEKVEVDRAKLTEVLPELRGDGTPPGLFELKRQGNHYRVAQTDSAQAQRLGPSS